MKELICPKCKGPLLEDAGDRVKGRLCSACRSQKGKLAELHLAFRLNRSIAPKWRRILREAGPLLVDYDVAHRIEALVDWVADRIKGNRSAAVDLPIEEVVGMVRDALAGRDSQEPKTTSGEWSDYSSPSLWAKFASCHLDTLKRRIKRLGIQVDKPTPTAKRWRFHPADVARLKEKPA